MPTYPGTRDTTRAELSSFLKSRRARIAPDDVGLDAGGRRRTPGLRREEVANLAGVGLTWYTWLEQGRDIRVSPQVLSAVARALQLESAERGHLFRLAGHAPPVAEATAAISPRLQRVIDAWDPFPAYVTGRRRDVVAWNHASDVIYGWSGLPDDKRNILHFMFLVPSARKLHVEWEQEAPLSIAALRAEAGRDLSDPDYRELIRELLEQSPEFAMMWPRQDVRDRLEGYVRMRHPQLGRFDIEYTSLQVTDQPSLRLYLFAPLADVRSASKLREILNSASAPTHEAREQPGSSRGRRSADRATRPARRT